MSASEFRDRAIKWVAAVTAIISLILGGQKLFELFTDRAERARQTTERSRDASESVALARQQAGRGDYADAWKSLERADARVRTPEADQARLDVAFLWLESARTSDGQPFSSITGVVMPALDRALLDEHHPRRADVLAHAGWARFLESRDSRVVPDPRPLWDQAADLYKQAIAIDRNNPYANAMLGHLLLWRREPIDAALPYFDAALASGRERAYVRRMQIAALRNAATDASDSELLKVANAIRQQRESIDTASARSLYGVYRSRYAQSVAIDPRKASVSPDDQLATYEWLAHMPDVSAGADVDARVAAVLKTAGG
jgi:tetratricopeptide (TPR) repeat protein